MNRLFKSILLLALIAFLATPAMAGLNDRFSDVGWETFPHGHVSISVTKNADTTQIIPVKSAKAVYQITGGYTTTTTNLVYTGAASTNKGKIFYVINSSSNPVKILQSGKTGVTVAAGKLVTVVGNGTDFIRITADQ